MDSTWQLLLAALPGIIPGTFALIGLWRLRRTQAERTDAERKDIEDQITGRVLARAKKEINGLSCENKMLKEDNEELSKRVQSLEENSIVLHENHEKLQFLVVDLKDGVHLLCGQLSKVGIEPAFSIGELDGGD